MRSDQERLFIHGFQSNGELKKKTAEERRSQLKQAENKKDLLKGVEEEVLEQADGLFSNTGYPKSAGHMRLVYESGNNSLEESYFWVLEHLRQDRGFPNVIKIIDAYAASEASAFWGNQQQRISAQQGQASQLLANIGKFVKELFQMVRELRIIDERLDAYEHWYYTDKNGNIKKSSSADVTLKSIFTDVVEGGTKNPQSVFGLAQTVGFTILPDLFFNTRVYKKSDIDKTIDKLDYNESIKSVLKRKLFQFISWKEKTHEELQNRRGFNIRYLRQHWAIIKMYMSWVKPYLRNLKQLRMMDDAHKDPEMISSFDTSLTEVEILAHKPAGKNMNQVVLVTFQFRSRPEMNIRKEYQQGPSHMGRLEMNFRAYGWSDDQIEAYSKMRAEEDWDLIGMLDPSLESIMDELGDDFHQYLEKHEATLPEKEKEVSTKKKKEKKEFRGGLEDTFEPFIALVGGFGELFGAFVPRNAFKKKPAPKTGDSKGAAGKAKGAMFLTYHIYKKAHRMLAW